MVNRWKPLMSKTKINFMVKKRMNNCTMVVLHHKEKKEKKEKKWKKWMMKNKKNMTKKNKKSKALNSNK